MLGITWLSFNIILAIAGILYVLDYFGFLQSIPLVNTLSGKMPRNPVFLMGAIVLVVVGFGWVSVGSVGDTIDNESPGPEVTTDIKDQQTVELEEQESSSSGGWLETTYLTSDGEYLHDLSGYYIITSLSISDINGDGYDDIVAGRFGNEMYWYENKGDGSLTPHQYNEISEFHDTYVDSADLNDDGHNDIVMNYVGNGTTVWHENNADGTFTQHKINSTSVNKYDIDIADLNNDGHPDILSTVGGYADERSNHWYENNGDGTFTKHEIHSDKDASVAIESADLDDDGNIDVITNANNYYKNNGEGTFTARELPAISNYNLEHGTSLSDMYKSIDIADIDNDSDKDFAVATPNTDYWYENDGTGNFEINIIYDESINTKDIKVTDINKDGYKDFVFASGYGSKDYWYENDGTESFIQHNINENAYNTNAIAIIDYNRDDVKDIVLGTGGEKNYRYEGIFSH